MCVTIQFWGQIILEPAMVAPDTPKIKRKGDDLGPQQHPPCHLPLSLRVILVAHVEELEKLHLRKTSKRPILLKIKRHPLVGGFKHAKRDE